MGLECIRIWFSIPDSFDTAYSSLYDLVHLAAMSSLLCLSSPLVPKGGRRFVGSSLLQQYPSQILYCRHKAEAGPSHVPSPHGCPSRGLSSPKSETARESHAARNPEWPLETVQPPRLARAVLRDWPDRVQQSLARRRRLHLALRPFSGHESPALIRVALE